MMHRFTLAVALYAGLCVLAALVIVLRGDGPHPRVVAIYPPNSDQYWPGGVAQITFSQPMTQASVESALQVSPGGQGQGAWYGNTFNLQPLGDWKPNMTYHVTLTGRVADELGRPLQTPISFWFHVHHVQHLDFCPMHGVRNVCERIGRLQRPLTRSSSPILQYALSSDGSTLAYIRRDLSGLPHLFIINVDGTGNIQLTHGRAYIDSDPAWTIDDTSDISYHRRPVVGRGARAQVGAQQLWNIQTDGSQNAQM